MGFSFFPHHAQQIKCGAQRQVVAFSSDGVLLGICDGRIKEEGSRGDWMETGRSDSVMGSGLDIKGNAERMKKQESRTDSGNFRIRKEGQNSMGKSLGEKR